MRTFLRSKVTLLFLTLGLLLAIPAIALADNVKNDVVAGGNDTIVTGGSTTINYEIQQTGSGGIGGCDATLASPVTVNINAPANVTASPSSLSFSSCGTQKSVAFSSNTAGNYDITVSTVDNVGDYNVTPAKFTLHVNNPPPPANDPPTLSLPGNQTAEATGPNGAAVTYTATANDAQDGALTPNCSPASGSTFALGSTQVNCSVQDSGGLTTSGFFSVTVQDTTAPELTVPADKTAEATGPGGAAVSFNDGVSATDLVDSNVDVTCNPASGSTFALGTTPVTCTATDDYGNSTTRSFDVTVEDTTAPVIANHGNVTAEATGPNGANVSYTSPTTTDAVDGSGTANCTPASGSTFALGNTTVTCTATDAAGNHSSSTFTVTVEDTTAPVIANHDDVSATATSANGANVSYTSPGTTDAVDGPGTANCTPASGTPFALGSTTVTCSATDAHGNTATSTFKVNVTVSASDFLQPINPDDSSIFKQGSTVPVKFQLTGASAGIQNAVANLRISKVSNNILGDEAEAITTTPASTGSLFRYDATSDQYIYNWGTKSYSAGTYQLRIDLGDGVGTRTVLISLKK